MRDLIVHRLNLAVRREGMYGWELAPRLYCEALASADGGEEEWSRIRDGLHSWGAFIATGVTGAVERFLGVQGSDIVASVYADVAHDHGWLMLDHKMNQAEYMRLQVKLRGWCAQDRNGREAIDKFGEPSAVLLGDAGRTLIYGAALAEEPLIFSISATC